MAVSRWRLELSRIPQGLVLFNSFINNINSGIEFSGDTKLSGKVNATESREVIQRDLVKPEK